MNSQVAKTKVKETLNKSFELFRPETDWQPIKSVRIQLQYIYDALQGNNDRSKLSEINIGIIAVREFENKYDEFADMLHDVSEISRLMKKNKL